MHGDIFLLFFIKKQKERFTYVCDLTSRFRQIIKEKKKTAEKAISCWGLNYQRLNNWFIEALLFNQVPDVSPIYMLLYLNLFNPESSEGRHTTNPVSPTLLFHACSSVFVVLK